MGFLSGGWKVRVLKIAGVWYLVGAMFVIAPTPRCFACFSSSEVIAFPPTDRPADFGKLQKILETQMVRERLKDLGFSPEEVRMKLNDLDDRQVHQLALRLDEMKVAGDGGAVVVIVLLAAILAVLIIYATGHRIVIQ
jgi:hypothetical protein